MFIETLIGVPKFDYTVPSCSEDEISVQSDFSQHRQWTWPYKKFKISNSVSKHKIYCLNFNTYCQTIPLSVMLFKKQGIIWSMILITLQSYLYYQAARPGFFGDKGWGCLTFPIFLFLSFFKRTGIRTIEKTIKQILIYAGHNSPTVILGIIHYSLHFQYFQGYFSIAAYENIKSSKLLCKKYNKGI